MYVQGKSVCISVAVGLAIVGRTSAFVAPFAPFHSTSSAGPCSADAANHGVIGPGHLPVWWSSRLSPPRAKLSAEVEGSSVGEGKDRLPGLPSLPGMKTVVETAAEEELRVAKEWLDDGRRGRVLLRRREVPTPETDPARACQIVFECLQNNDDPMLDYGAAVAIKFASKRNAVRDMTPKDYGAFLRNDPEQGLLIDNFSCRPAERGKVSPDGKQVLQKVELVGNYPDTSKRVVDVQLTRDEETECWLIDAISFVPL